MMSVYKTEVLWTWVSEVVQDACYRPQ